MNDDLLIKTPQMKAGHTIGQALTALSIDDALDLLIAITRDVLSQIPAQYQDQASNTVAEMIKAKKNNEALQ